MKILMLISSLDCGGAETHVSTLTRSLVKNGHNVWVASKGGREADSLAREGIPQIRINLASHNPLRLLASKIKLSRLVRRNSFDVIHAHSRIAALLGSSVARKQRIAFVTTVHARFKVGFISRRLSRWGSLSIAVSEDLKQYLCEEYGVLSDNVFVIPNGIDTERFKPLADRTSRSFRIAFVSRMDKDCSQGAHWLCRIAPMLNKCIKDLDIVLCGGGNAYESVKKEAIRANRIIGRECIRMLGRVGDTAEALRGANIFVGVSRAALEAMSMEIPTLLCGNEGFFGEICEDNFLESRAENFCGRGEHKGSADRLFREIIKIYSMTPEKRAKRGRALGEAVRRFNGNQEVARVTEGVYRLALSRIPDPRGEIVLCGFYGFGNLGDDSLLLESIKKCGREYEGMKVSALTLGGKRDVERFGVRCVARQNPFAVMKEIRRADIFVFGGGTLLQEYSSRRSLLYYTSLLRYAQKNGVRCELWGNGIGEPRSDRSAALVADVLGKCAYVGLRDSASVKLVRELCAEFGVTCPHICYEPDLAIDYSRTSNSRVDFLLKKYAPVTLNPKGFAVVSVRGGSGRGFIKSLSQRLFDICREGRSILFVPMFPKEDMRLTKRLAKSFDGRVAEALSGKDLAGIMARAAEVCGMRLHTLVFAFSAGISFVGIGEDSKIESFCRENGGRYYTDIEGEKK